MEPAVSFLDSEDDLTMLSHVQDSLFSFVLLLHLMTMKRRKALNNQTFVHKFSRLDICKSFILLYISILISLNQNQFPQVEFTFEKVIKKTFLIHNTSHSMMLLFTFDTSIQYYHSDNTLI